jgi:hypothetical protein
MSHSSKAIELDDVEFRVAELERSAEGQKKKPRKPLFLPD